VNDLEALRPRRTLRKNIWLLAAALITLSALVASYVWTDIHPVRLWEKRQNAFEYLFGRPPADADKREARRLAERMPEMVSREQARAELRTDPVAQALGEDAKKARVDARAQEILRQRSTAEWAQEIDVEYTRLLEERRGGYFPPESNPTRLREYAVSLLETIAMAIWGSLLAFLTAIPFAFFAAENTLSILFPGRSRLHRAGRFTGQFVARRVLDVCRGFNEYVMALIFVAVIGLGPFAGVLALWIHTFGILGKVVSEAMEAADPGQVESTLAAGARPIQVLAFAILPQTMPTIVSYSLLRFEANVRSATILGFVGAGGIGFLLVDKLSGYLYREVASMMLLIILAVGLIDHLTGRLRRLVT